MSTGPWRSKLIPYERSILLMWKNRHTLAEIRDFLKEHKISISLPGLSKFIKVRRTKSDPHRFKIPKRDEFVLMSKEEEARRIAEFDKKLKQDFSNFTPKNIHGNNISEDGKAQKMMWDDFEKNLDQDEFSDDE